MKNAVKRRKNHFVNRSYYTILTHGCKARSIQEFAVFQLENCVFFYGNAFVRIWIGKNFQFNITHVFLPSAHTASGQKSGRARNRDDGTQIVLHFCQVCHRSRSGLTRKKGGKELPPFFICPKGLEIVSAAAFGHNILWRAKIGPVFSINPCPFTSCLFRGNVL